MKKRLKSRAKPIPDPIHVPIGPGEAAEPTYAESRAGLTLRERRVAEVAAMMSRGAWLSGVTDELLAQKWNCCPSNVRTISAEANRLIRARLRDDPEAQREARALLLQNIDTIRAKAMGNGDPQSLRVGLDALRAYGFYLGIEPAKKLDVTERHDPVEGWTVDEMLAFAKEGRRPRRSLEGKTLGGTARPASDGNGVDHGNGADDESVH
jgi:hypothetical protein